MRSKGWSVLVILFTNNPKYFPRKSYTLNSQNIYCFKKIYIFPLHKLHSTAINGIEIELNGHWIYRDPHLTFFFFLESFNKSFASARISKVAPSILPLVKILVKLVVKFVRRPLYDMSNRYAIWLLFSLQGWNMIVV